MRRFRLPLCLAFALSAFAYSGAASALPGACAVGLSVHNHARIVLHHKTIATCSSKMDGCKCVSCYGLDGKVYSACYPLLAGIPH